MNYLSAYKAIEATARKYNITTEEVIQEIEKLLLKLCSQLTRKFKTVGGLFHAKAKFQPP